MRKFALVLTLCSSAGLFAADTAHDRLTNAAKVFNQVMATPDKGIPRDLLGKAHCIVIVPGMKQAALGIGGKFGRGFAVCREHGANWGGPAAVRVEGGSAGFQIGASNTDIVMLVMNDGGMRHLLEDKFMLGTEATVAAGPVGRQASASSDVQMSAEILSWSRSKGLFGGIALHGATLRQDVDMNEELYGSRVTNEKILTGDRVAPVGMMAVLTAALNRYSPGGDTGRARSQR